MEIKRWSAVTKEQKMEMLLKMKWKDFRCYLHKYFENEGGNENPEAVKRKKHDEIESQSTWGWLCDFWSTDEFKGPLPKKGSKRIRSSTTTSNSNEIENAYEELQNWKEKMEAKYVRLLNFIKTRFPDFTDEDNDDSTNPPPNTPLAV
ncbi:hypothetical protein PanWU01x14_251970 [Parasponia andersonii]|uniref:Uncharacterized protein n=1 Tax=Parasponia andersonii TaxID=3476 RepID=A0A2P5BC86_PARAD|nr:hypothetical protein PanWU01x14_251970 [Parasponia andersonii]